MTARVRTRRVSVPLVGAVVALRALSQTLTQLRAERGWSRATLADEIGVNMALIRKLEYDQAVRLSDVVPVLEYLNGRLRVIGDENGERLRAARVADNLTQRDVAREIGIDPATLSRYERGLNIYRPSSALIERWLDRRETRATQRRGRRR